jgi:4-aminobutyrate--pyruvate transaminase
MAEISRFATHNEYPDHSVEGMDLRHMLHPSTNLAQHQQHGPMVLESAEGVYITDNQGKQYLEGMSGLWCTAIGYGQEELAKVAYEQMRKLNYSQLFAGRTNEPSVLLADKLKKMAPFDAGRVFFGLSGSDANDTQIKLIWYYNNAIGRPEKKKNHFPQTRLSRRHHCQRLLNRIAPLSRRL